MTETAPADGTGLYRIWGEADLLLYIGISDHFGTRWRQHASRQPWWGEMRRLSVDAWYASRQEAEEVETAAIKTEKPKYNKKHMVPAPPKPKRERKHRPPEDDVVIYVDLPPGEPTTRFLCEAAGVTCLRVMPPGSFGCYGGDGPGFPCLLKIRTPAQLLDMGVVVRTSHRDPEGRLMLLDGTPQAGPLALSLTP